MQQRECQAKSAPLQLTCESTSTGLDEKSMPDGRQTRAAVHKRL
jgi:hypothetical protein